MSMRVPSWVFHPEPVSGVFIVQPQRFMDARGYSQRNFDGFELAQHGLETNIDHTLISLNQEAGTIRGMHWQAEPAAQTKVITCLQGAIYDVLLDLRPESPTYLKWHGIKLDDRDGWMIYVPKGIAHGYQTLDHKTVVTYAISAPEAPEHARRARWNDPTFKIRWPLPCEMIADADRDAPLWGTKS
jgi:dTDP-4-dehydrorhamnose 3,5-epimerase